MAAEAYPLVRILSTNGLSYAHMTHPNQAILDEFQFAINHLVATVPADAKARAQKMHDDLLANPEATELDVEAAMYATGREEYPHRHAFKEMTSGSTEARRVEIVLEHVEPNVAAVVKKFTESGVGMEEFVHSDLFETELTPEERHQIEDALLDADIHIKEELGQTVVADAAKYASLVKKWEAHRDVIEARIAELASLANTDEKWKSEINDKAREFRDGFLVTEPDVELEVVEKEIEYWKGTLGEEV